MTKYDKHEDRMNTILHAWWILSRSLKHVTSGKLQEEFLLQQKEIQRQHEQEQSRQILQSVFSRNYSSHATNRSGKMKLQSLFQQAAEEAVSF